MPIFNQVPAGIGQDGFTASTTQGAALGAIAFTRDGRIFRYAKAGAADLVAGNVVQSPAVITAHLALTPSAAAIGASQVVATLGATAAAAGLYAEGFVGVDTTTGNGYAYQISGHAAVLSSGVITANLRLEDSVQIALTGTSRVGFMQNAYSGVIQCPTTLTGLPVGVATYVIPAGQFGWIQVGGPAEVLINGTPALGAAVVNSATTAGAVDVITTTNLVTSRAVGSMMQLGVSGKNNWVFVQM
jgi:hypothetical protein